MDGKKLIKNILKDVKVELDGEFDRNFERKAFFDRPWAPLSPNYTPTNGDMLERTGDLRHSLRSRIDGNSINYYSSRKYAGVQNDGGTIRQDFEPTPKMRRWAWAKFKQTGDDKYKRMAMAKRIKRTFTIPARPFVGDHPQVRGAIEEVIGQRVGQAMEQDIEAIINIKKKG